MDASNVILKDENLTELDENNLELTVPQYILDIRDNVESNTMYFEKWAEEIVVRNKINYDELPINVWKIARNMGFKIIEASFSGKLENVVSLMYDGKKPPTFLEKVKVKRAIIINHNDSNKEQAFYIAYQIAIFTLYFKIGLNQISILRSLNIKRVNTKEHALNSYKFATMILMPKKKVIEEIDLLKELENKSTIINILSDRFMIPVEYTRTRLEDLNLLSTLGGDNNE